MYVLYMSWGAFGKLFEFIKDGKATRIEAFGHLLVAYLWSGSVGYYKGVDLRV
jgi:hypothetical protein